MFEVYNRPTAAVEPIEYKAGTLLKTGMAVTVNTSDQFVKATGAAVPTHIIVGEKQNGVWGGAPIMYHTVYEVPTDPAVDTVAKNVQIAADGLTVNNTTGGAFHVTWTNGVDKARGYFEEVHA